MSYTGQDIMNAIQSCTLTIDACIKDLRKRAYTKAQTEMDYRVALAQKLLIERDKGLPATISNDVCRGQKEIAKLRFDRDIAKSMYDIVLQKVYASKAEYATLEKQYRLEFNNTK